MSATESFKCCRVALSSGEVFWIDATLEQVFDLFNKRALIWVGSRLVNSTQVAEVRLDRMPDIETAERLEDEDGLIGN